MILITFPKLKNKHAKDSMFTPKDYLNYAKNSEPKIYPKYKCPRGVILCYNEPLMDHIKKHHGVKKVKWFHADLYFLKETNHQIAVAGNFGIGAPCAVLRLEELIAFGVEKFISIGTAGALQKHLKIGDVIVCDRAVRDEGTSHHYLKNSKYSYPSKTMTEKIINAMIKNKQKHSIGTTWTIDAPYRETVAEAKQYQKEGVCTVEMEAAALFAAAKYRKSHIGCILTVSDSLAELQWNPGFHMKETHAGLETLYRIAKEAIIK